MRGSTAVGTIWCKKISWDAKFIERGSRTWELNIMFFTGDTLRSWDVRDEHVRKSSVSLCELRNTVTLSPVKGVERVSSLLGAASHLDRGTIHVHLSISNIIEPRPSKCVFSRSDALRDRVSVRVRVRSVEVATCIFGRTPTLNGVDDLPFGTLCGWRVLGQGKLARASTMHGGTNEREDLWGADSHVGDRRT